MARVPGAEVVLGEVVGVFGIRGELRLHLHHRESASLREPRDVVLVSKSGERRPVRIQVRTGTGRRIIGRVDGIQTPEDAAALHGWQVIIARDALPDPDEGEYYVHDLLGLSVQDENGVALGEIADVVAGERDIWVVQTGAGEAYLIASPENVIDVDVELGRVVVRAESLDHGDV